MSETEKKAITVALIKKRLYNPYDVFQHAPEFYEVKDEKYMYELHLIKWNTRSTRVSIYLVRYDLDKGWVFASKKGQKRTSHGEKMR